MQNSESQNEVAFTQFVAPKSDGQTNKKAYNFIAQCGERSSSPTKLGVVGLI